MFKRMLLACGVVLPLGLAGAVPTALAYTGVNIHYGIPFYNYPRGPNYRYSDNYGWYDVRRYPNYRDGYSEPDYIAVDPVRLSCGEARRIVRANGFRNVGARDCNGRTYSFVGTRNGRSFIVYVNSRNGRVWRS